MPKKKIEVKKYADQAFMSTLGGVVSDDFLKPATSALSNLVGAGKYEPFIRIGSAAVLGAMFDIEPESKTGQVLSGAIGAAGGDILRASKEVSGDSGTSYEDSTDWESGEDWDSSSLSMPLLAGHGGHDWIEGENYRDHEYYEIGDADEYYDVEAELGDDYYEIGEDYFEIGDHGDYVVEGDREYVVEGDRGYIVEGDREYVVEGDHGEYVVEGDREYVVEGDREYMEQWEAYEPDYMD